MKRSFRIFSRPSFWPRCTSFCTPWIVKIRFSDARLTRETSDNFVQNGHAVSCGAEVLPERPNEFSGTFNLGMGEKFDASGGRTLAAGSFAFMPSGMKQFAWAKGETVIQVHGMGPWQINYVNPADDPRNKK